MTLSSGPWFSAHLRPKLVTTSLLEWAYPCLITPARQASNPNNAMRPFVVPPAALEGGLTIDGLRDSRVDVWVRSEGEKVPSLLVSDVLTSGDAASGAAIARPTLMTDGDQFAKLSTAKSYSRKFILRLHSPSPFEPLWSSPPVQFSDFENVGHAFFGILCGWFGSAICRYLFATRDSVQ